MNRVLAKRPKRKQVVPGRPRRRMPHEYPPDDGGSRTLWKRNMVCVPCRYATRSGGWGMQAHHPERCPTCRSALLPMPFSFSVPRKQDRWWTSAEALRQWSEWQAAYHIRREADPLARPRWIP